MQLDGWYVCAPRSCVWYVPLMPEVRGARRLPVLACPGTVGTASAHHRHRCSALGKSIPSERGAAWWLVGPAGQVGVAAPTTPGPAYTTPRLGPSTSRSTCTLLKYMV